MLVPNMTISNVDTLYNVMWAIYYSIVRYASSLPSMAVLETIISCNAESAKYNGWILSSETSPITSLECRELKK